jgi:hypothetical protein
MMVGGRMEGGEGEKPNDKRGKKKKHTTEKEKGRWHQNPNTVVTALSGVVFSVFSASLILTRFLGRLTHISLSRSLLYTYFLSPVGTLLFITSLSHNASATNSSTSIITNCEYYTCLSVADLSWCPSLCGIIIGVYVLATPTHLHTHTHNNETLLYVQGQRDLASTCSVVGCYY